MSPIQFSGFMLGLRQPQRGLAGLLRRRECLFANVSPAPSSLSLRQHLRRRDAVGDAVVDLHQHRPPIVGEPLDDPALPERALSVEPMLHDSGDHREQFGVIAGLGQRDAVEVARDVEVRVVHPFRRAEVERVGMQYLGAAWNFDARSANADTRSP